MTLAYAAVVLIMAAFVPLGTLAGVETWLRFLAGMALEPVLYVAYRYRHSRKRETATPAQEAAVRPPDR